MSTEEKTPTPKATPKAKAKQAESKVFTKRFYVPGHGFVDKGDDCTEAIRKAWKTTSKVDIDNYLEVPTKE